MTYTETLNYIHSLGKFKHEASLDRIKTVLEKTGNPQNDFKSIHIAGTNGKGSTCVYISEILKSAGYKTGLFISPFVVDFRERIQINGEYISEADLCFFAQKVIDANIPLNEFEFITAVAFLYFKENKTDVAVIETGLGGRLDATNVLENLLCCTITKIGLDHTKILGDTVEEITREKCGILRENIPTVTTYNQDKTALGVIKAFDKDTVVPDTPKIIKSDILGNTFIYKGKTYKTSLAGIHQVYNAITAIETVFSSSLKFCEDDIKNGLKAASFPARLEVLRNDPLYIIDGAHNPDGANSLKSFLCENKGISGIIAMMKDKDCEQFLKITLPFFESVIVTEIDNPRCMPASELGELSKKYCKNVTVCEDADKAIEKSLRLNKTVLAFGSLYFASDVRNSILKSK